MPANPATTDQSAEERWIVDTARACHISEDEARALLATGQVNALIAFYHAKKAGTPTKGARKSKGGKDAPVA